MSKIIHFCFLFSSPFLQRTRNIKKYNLFSGLLYYFVKVSDPQLKVLHFFLILHLIFESCYFWTLLHELTLYENSLKLRFFLSLELESLQYCLPSCNNKIFLCQVGFILFLCQNILNTEFFFTIVTMVIFYVKGRLFPDQSKN